jgi:hypothetical protein
MCAVRGMGGSYTALDSSNKQTLENLAGLVAVADVLECLGRVLAADVEHACGAREWSAGGTE